MFDRKTLYIARQKIDQVLLSGNVGGLSAGIWEQGFIYIFNELAGKVVARTFLDPKSAEMHPLFL